MMSQRRERRKPLYLDVTENKTGLATATLVARTIRQEIRQAYSIYMCHTFRYDTIMCHEEPF